MNRIRGKRILITGASAGIGEACARLFATEGANLILLARRADRIATLKNALVKNCNVEVAAMTLDVRKRDDVMSFGEEIEKNGLIPDVLINNAGLASGLSYLHEGDIDDWERMIDTNVKGLLYMSRAVIPLMLRKEAGHIVNVGSIAGYQVYPRGNVYNATKFAVRALTEGMNVDLLGTNIRVSAINPGATETEFSEVRFHGDSERAATMYTGFQPLSSDDIAAAIHFIINAPEHVNVQTMTVTPTAQRSVSLLHRDTV